MNLLETINSPRDLKKLDRSQLPEIAEEIRKYIVQVVSRTGGHLASSLGAVELTIAIHYTYITKNLVGCTIIKVKYISNVVLAISYCCICKSIVYLSEVINITTYLPSKT